MDQELHSAPLWLSVRFQCAADGRVLQGHGRHADHHGGISRRRTKTLDGAGFRSDRRLPRARCMRANGQPEPIIDERATPEQRRSAFQYHVRQVLRRRHAVPDPQPDRPKVSRSAVRAHSTLSFDKDGRVAATGCQGQCWSPDVELIKNPVSGAPRRIQVVMPEGIRTQGCRGCLGRHPLDRRDKIRNQGHAQLAGERRSDAGGCRGLAPRAKSNFTCRSHSGGGFMTGTLGARADPAARIA